MKLLGSQFKSQEVVKSVPVRSCVWVVEAGKKARKAWRTVASTERQGSGGAGFGAEVTDSQPGSIACWGSLSQLFNLSVPLLPNNTKDVSVPPSEETSLAAAHKTCSVTSASVTVTTDRILSVSIALVS